MRAVRARRTGGGDRRGALALLACLGMAACSSGRDPVDALRSALRVERESAQTRLESRTLRLASYVGPSVARGAEGTARFAPYWTAWAAGSDAAPADPPARAQAPIVFGNGFAQEPATAQDRPAATPELGPREQLIAAGYSTDPAAARRLVVEGAALLVSLEPRDAASFAAGSVVCSAADDRAEAALLELALGSARGVGATLPRPSHRLCFLVGGDPRERAILLAGLQGSWRAALVLALDAADEAAIATLWRPADPGAPAAGASPAGLPSASAARDGGVARAPQRQSPSALALFGRAGAIDAGAHLGPEALVLPTIERAYDPSRASGLYAPGAQMHFGLAPDEGFLPEQLGTLERRREQLLAGYASAAWALADARPSDLDRYLESWLIELRLRVGLEPLRAVPAEESASWERHLDASRWWLRQVCLGLTPAENQRPDLAAAR